MNIIEIEYNTFKAQKANLDVFWCQVQEETYSMVMVYGTKVLVCNIGLTDEIDFLSWADQSKQCSSFTEASLKASLSPKADAPIQIQTTYGVAMPVAADGKLFVLPNSFPGEVLLNFTGCNDKLSPPERFGGEIFGLQQVDIGTTSIEIDFLDGIFLAGGHVDWDGGHWGNNVYMELLAPATTTKAPVVAGQGNCNKVPTPYGFNIIVPAAGNGQYDLDVTIPIPAYNDETNVQTGYWNHSEPWIGRGTVSPAAGNGKYNLYDTPLELAHFCKLHLFLPTGQRDFVAPAIKPKWILPEWKIKVVIENKATGTLRVCWDLLIARRKSI